MTDDQITWTPEAEADLQKAPEFAQQMARQSTEEYVRERGERVVTMELWQEALRRRFPNGAPW